MCTHGDCTDEHIGVGARGQCQVSSSLNLHLIFKTETLDLKLIIELVWLANELQRCSCLCPGVLKLQNHTLAHGFPVGANDSVPGPDSRSGSFLPAEPMPQPRELWTLEWRTQRRNLLNIHQASQTAGKTGRTARCAGTWVLFSLYLVTLPPWA